MLTKDGAWYKVSTEERTRLLEDPEYCRAAFERQLGSSTHEDPSPQGYYRYLCPFPGCHDARHGHLGVRFERFEGKRCGNYFCSRCGEFGSDFLMFCDALDATPTDFIDGLTPVAFERRDVRKVNPENFRLIWDWIQNKSPSAGGVHEERLLRRGIEWNKTPGWFVIPQNTIIDKAIDLFGLETAIDASILTIKEERTLFSQPGRILLRYPDWRSGRSYQRGTNPKIIGPTGISSYPYIRIRKGSTTISIVEGEPGAEASYQAGVSSIGVPGVATCRLEVAQIIYDHIVATGKKITIFIVFDSEIKPSTIALVTRSSAKLYDIIREKTQDLPSHLHPEILIGRIPILGEREKADSDSYIEDIASETSLKDGRDGWKDLLRTFRRKKSSKKTTDRF